MSSGRSRLVHRANEPRPRCLCLVVGNTADLLIWAFCGGAGCSAAQGGLGRAETMLVGG